MESMYMEKYVNWGLTAIVLLLNQRPPIPSCRLSAETRAFQRFIPFSRSPYPLYHFSLAVSSRFLNLDIFKFLYHCISGWVIGTCKNEWRENFEFLEILSLHIGSSFPRILLLSVASQTKNGDVSKIWRSGGNNSGCSAYVCWNGSPFSFFFFKFRFSRYKCPSITFVSRCITNLNSMRRDQHHDSGKGYECVFIWINITALSFQQIVHVADSWYCWSACVMWAIRPRNNGYANNCMIVCQALRHPHDDPW
jgi:hypothetical protein